MLVASNNINLLLYSLVVIQSQWTKTKLLVGLHGFLFLSFLLCVCMYVVVVMVLGIEPRSILPLS